MPPIRERRVRPHYPPSLLRQRFDEELVLMPGYSLLCKEYEDDLGPQYEPEPRKSVRFNSVKSPETPGPVVLRSTPIERLQSPITIKVTAPSPKRPTAARGKTPPVARSPSPADRSPPRSTPTHTFSKSLSPLSDDDEADDDDDNGGDHGLIPKPSGQCGRLKRDGYSLEDTLKWGDDYQKIYDSVKLLAVHILNKSLLISQQTLEDMRTVCYLASKEHPRLLKYQDDWPTRDMITTAWSNVRKKSKAAVQPTRSTAGPSRRSTPAIR